MEDIIEMIDETIEKINYFLWEEKRNINKFLLRDVCSKSDISIISCNCIGGMVCHEMNIKFLTPTINLYFSFNDFLKFCEGIKTKKYLDVHPIDLGKSKKGDYPLIGLDDIVIEAVHYNSFNDFYKKWEERKTRINYKKIFLIFTDRDGFDGTIEILNRIKNIPYPKVFFSKQDYPGFDFVFKINGYEKEKCVGDLTKWNKKISWNRKYHLFPFYKTFKKLKYLEK